nr:retrotransposon protein, putative, Ty3-gypsy subclass [Tanacetum cinerariifolium]
NKECYLYRSLELFSDYECEIKYHPSKTNVVADALTRKERVKPRRVRSMAMTIHSGVKGLILTAQGEAFKNENMIAKGLNGGVRTKIMDEAHKMRYSVHPRADKMYYDLRDMYWWSGMKKEIAIYLARLYIDEIVTRHGASTSIISDRDGRFTSRFWKTMQKALGTRLDMSTAYHPQTDGQSEHTIQTLEDMLRACVIDFGGS